MRIEARVESQAVINALRAGRRELNGDVKKVLLGVMSARVLPHARRIAPGVVRRDLAVTASGTNGFLTVRRGLRGPLRARVAVLNFGGVIRAPIRPRRARALRLADGNFRMVVRRPRRITGKHFMEEAVAAKRPEAMRELEGRVTHLIQAHIDRARGRA